MLQITEDTPPDMLAGAMDLTVHLPNGKSVKMAVQRSTPMMDLLVQITTNHHLQLSNYILQALDMAPSSDHMEKVLPYKPSTPIGALDTQHIKVVPKTRSSNGSSTSGTSVPKNLAPGQQPFESTFRLKVHLPRNQLYVTRVSRNVLLEDIMRKVCEEKNLDVHKYEFKHPANLDTVLDPKLTLSDYQITEIYLVTKGTFTQSFSSNDIMALRKEEERKQMHNKTGGGVFNLIFRRSGGGTGNTAVNNTSGSGSLSSENRSISPTHSDDSRSETPPAVEPPIPERPKPPQRKRRPAPKPPGNSRPSDQQDANANVSAAVMQPAVERVSNTTKETNTSGLTICHSRNSSDSSGYHEAASILSDHCNTSLPRQRPKSMAFLSASGHSGAPSGSNQNLHHISKGESQEKLNRFSSMSNLAQMTGHSKSTSSLVPPGRKKKAAPPPPPPPTVQVKPTIAEVSSSDIVTSDSSVTITPTPTVVASPIVARIASQKKIESEKVDNTGPPATTTVTSSNQESIDTSISISTPAQSVDTASSKGNTDINLLDYKENVNSRKTEDVVDSKGNSNTNIETECSLLKNIEDKQVSEHHTINNDLISTNDSHLVSTTQTDLDTNKKVSLNHINEGNNTSVTVEKCTSELKNFENNELDWQYQLPSPPKAFKDSSPLNEPDDHFDGETKDSIVTSPELFEKLKELKELERESVCSAKSDESDPNILNKLSLENLEKRKSLVYNRELATSLKLSDSKPKKEITSDMENFGDFDSSISKFEMTFNEVRNTNFTKNKTSTLPNFKITTYDNPKQKIKVFEDESIRSSENSQIRKNNVVLQRHEFNRSMENISRSYASNDSDYYFYKPPVNRSTNTSLNNTCITRSGSFIDQNNQISNWEKSESKPKSPTKPVVRSKSSLTMNRYGSTHNKMHSKDTIDRQTYHFESSNLGKSSSLFDVSGLQSLEVMKLIQTKLNTPTTSMENLNHTSTNSEKNDSVINQAAASKFENSYQTPTTSINMGTWSDRQSQASSHIKEPLSLNSSKLIVKTVNNGVVNSNSFEVQNKKNHNIHSSNGGGGITVKISNNENVPSQEHSVSGNVIIKIGQNNNQYNNINHNYINTDHKANNKAEKVAPELKSFISHTTASGYRRPFIDINKNNQKNVENIDNNSKRSTQRPHSIALDGNVDISRVPIVRAVELKKPYRDLPTYNRSITQILGIPFSGDLDKEINSKSTSPLFPTSSKISANNKWSVGPSSYSTLPNRNSVPNNYTTNKDVPFSQSSLRRTESSKLLNNDASVQYKSSGDNGPKSLNIDNTNKRKNGDNLVQIDKAFSSENKSVSHRKDGSKSNKKIIAMTTPPPPPPPIIASNKNGKQINACGYNEDPREALLSAIRNFGGKKGLKNVN